MFRKRPEARSIVEWMIVGLGNPGGEYRGTRHNVGFDVLERLATAHHIKIARGKHRAMIGTGTIRGVGLALVKPLTYMNLSGQAVAPLCRDLSVPPQRLLVVADDLDLPVGKIRLKAKGSAGGHNGHKSLIASLRTDEYPRLKIGIGKVDRSATVDHVLGPFDRDERPLIEAALQVSVEACEAIVANGWDAGLRVLERYNAPAR